VSRLLQWLTPLLLFAATTVAGQSGFATVNGEQLYYEIAGSGPPVILIHGWSLNRTMWDFQVPPLSRHFRVIRYDRRGFGRSTGKENRAMDTDDLHALLDQLGVRKAHLIGMSQGAGVAIQFAREYPERISSIVLQASGPPDGFPLQWSGTDRPRFDDWGRIVREKGLGAFRREWIAHPLMAVPSNRPDLRARIERVIADYRGSRFFDDPSTPAAGTTAPVSLQDLPSIRTPTLVVSGENEVPFLQIVARAIAYYLPDAKLIVIAGGGHLINLVQPARYNAAVLEFLLKSHQ
jgi:pimeloyl-ACP methyl ester carboxylesterase